LSTKAQPVGGSKATASFPLEPPVNEAETVPILFYSKETAHFRLVFDAVENPLPLVHRSLSLSLSRSESPSVTRETPKVKRFTEGDSLRESERSTTKAEERKTRPLHHLW
jgi:hypothetical protein